MGITRRTNPHFCSGKAASKRLIVLIVSLLLIGSVWNSGASPAGLTGTATMFKVRNTVHSNSSTILVVLQVVYRYVVLFITFSVLVANPRQLLEAVDDPLVAC